MLSVQEKQFQEKQSGSDDLATYGEFEPFIAFPDGNHQNRFKDETSTYCNKKGHTETVCIANRDNDKMNNKVNTLSAGIAEQITATNTKATTESILDEFKRIGTTTTTRSRSP